MVSDTAFWEYAFLVAVLFALPLALLVCGLLALGGVSALLRNAGGALLVLGALVIVRQVVRTGVSDLMPEFAIPALVAAAVVYPLAAIALVRGSSPGTSPRLASPRAAATLFVAASVVQFAAPWMLTSGQ